METDVKATQMKITYSTMSAEQMVDPGELRRAFGVRGLKARCVPRVRGRVDCRREGVVGNLVLGMGVRGAAQRHGAVEQREAGVHVASS